MHCLRLIVSGLFDRFPKLKIIIGHMGEALPYYIARADAFLAQSAMHLKRRVSEYFHEHFYITTSGNFRTQALTDVILEVGAERVLYSVDYPFEDMVEAASWCDQVAISEPDRLKIARGNAQKLFHL